MPSAPSSSAGFGGSGPDGITSTPSIAPTTIASSTLASPVRTPVRPGSEATSSKRLTLPFRRSASRSSVRSPCWDSEIARFVAVVVLPSMGPGDVIRIERRGFTARLKLRLVRMMR